MVRRSGLSLALKSGDFGGEDFFARVLNMLSGTARAAA